MDRNLKRVLRKKLQKLVYPTKCSLPEVKEKVVEFLDLDLIPSDVEKFLESKYIKYCLQHVESTISKGVLCNTDSPQDIQRIARGLINARHLKELPKEISDAVTHLKLIQDEVALLSETDIENILRRIKVAAQLPLMKIAESLTSGKTSLDLCLSLMKKAMLEVYSVVSHGVTSQPNEALWHARKSSFHEKGRIYESVYRKNMEDIQTLIQKEFDDLVANVEDFFKAKRGEIADELKLPLQFQMKAKHGRNICIFRKPYVLLSESLPEIERQVASSQKIDEVHIIASEVFYIDADLNQEVWHGKNVVIICKLLACIVPGTIWDVSGLNGNRGANEPAKDGIIKGEDGSHGEHGNPGENGGHGLFLAATFQDMENFTFKTNGGIGGDGQTGGNGAVGENGKDGESISIDTLREWFPSPAKFFSYSRNEALEACITKLNNLLVSVEDHATYSKDVNLETGTRRSRFGETSCHIQGYTTNNLHIEFSYFAMDYMAYPKRQTYILVKGGRGTSGSPGGFGGEGGQAGMGGASGGFCVLDLNGNKLLQGVGREESCHGINGENGKDGINGARGCPGKHGDDVGYMDSQWWKRRVVVGPGCLSLEKYDSSVDKCCWCRHYNKFVSIVDYQGSRSDEFSNTTGDTARQATRTKEWFNPPKNTPLDRDQILDEYNAELIERDSKHQMQQHLQSTQASLREFLNSVDSLDSQLKEEIQREIERSNERKKVAFIRQFTPNEEQNKYIDKGGKFGGQLPLLYVPDFSKEVIDLLHERFIALETIRTKMQEGWHAGKDMVVLAKRPTTSSDRASALHAVFGRRDHLGFYQFKGDLRREVCRCLKTYLTDIMSVSEAKTELQNSLTAFFKDCNEKRAFVTKTSSRLVHQDHSVSNTTTPNTSVPIQRTVKNSLKDYSSSFHDNPDQFEWEKLFENYSVIREYFGFLGQPNIPLLESDMRLIGIATSTKINVYQIFEALPDCLPINVRGDSDICIGYDENYEFYRLEKITKRDLVGLNSRMDQIIDNVFSSNVKQLRSYVKTEGFKRDRVLYEKPHLSQQVELIRDISTIFDLTSASAKSPKSPASRTKALLIETALHFWSIPALRIFHGSLIIRNAKSHMDSFNFIFSRITELALDGISSTPITWAMATHPVDDWTTEVCLNIFEESFEDIGCKDIAEWRRVLGKLPTKLRCQISKLVRRNGEKYFKKTEKGKWLKFLLDIGGNHLHPQMNFDKLEGIAPSQWPTVLDRLYLETKLIRLRNVSWNDSYNKHSQAVYYLMALYNERKQTVDYFLSCLEKKLEEENAPFINLTECFCKFYGGSWELNEEVIEMLKGSKSVLAWSNALEERYKQCKKTEQSLRSIEKIKSLIQNDTISTVTKDNLNSIFDLVDQLISEDFASNMLKWKLLLAEHYPKSLNTWLNSFQERRNKQPLGINSLSFVLEAIYMIDIVLKMEMGIQLRATQKLAILAGLYHGSLNEKENLICQVPTGEGKTYIVLGVAIVRGLFEEQTDVVTSSNVLAQRDASSYKQIYSLFKLEVGEVSSENQNERARAYHSDVVYGDVSSFQRDYLLDQFYIQNIRGPRKHQNLIVDEVDSMFLDKGNCVLYLSHQPTDLHTLEEVFVPIWLSVTQAVSSSGKQSAAMVYSNLLNRLFPTISIDSLVELSEITDVRRSLMQFLVNVGVVVGNGRISETIPNSSDIVLPPLPTNLKGYEKPLKYFIETRLNLHGRIRVMKWLQPFVERHLLTWISSAFRACQLTEGKEYVVDVGHSHKKNPQIIILDLDTGVDLSNSQWNDGLHQFLQLKHGCQLSLLNLKSVFISNISFFKKYEKIFGLTGTIGTQSDRDFLEKTYNVRMLCIPLAQPKRFIEEEPIVCLSEIEWKHKILEEIDLKVAQLNRSVLVICETLLEAEKIYSYVKRDLRKTDKQSSIELYRRDYEQFRATSTEAGLLPGKVIIATNLAGRGTNIRLSNELKEADGLHVILAYLPANLRVEQQAFGRASRFGDKGSGKLIFFNSIAAGDSENGKDAIFLKITRDQHEAYRVSDIQTYYNNVVKKEEEVFFIFQSIFDSVLTKLDAYQTSVKQSIQYSKSSYEDMRGIIVSSMLDEWAFWLDKYSSHLNHLYESISNNNKNVFGSHKLAAHERDSQAEKKLMKEFREFTFRYEEAVGRHNPHILSKAAALFTKSGPSFGFDALPWDLIREPAMRIKIAKELIKAEEHAKALKYLEDVIISDNSNSIVAKYYKLICKIQLKEEEEFGFRSLLFEVRQSIEDYKMKQSSFASAIQRLTSIGKQKICIGDGYQKQKEMHIKLLSKHTDTLDTLFGPPFLTSSYFKEICNEEKAEGILKILTENKLLEEPKFVSMSEENLPMVRKLAKQFGLPSDPEAEPWQYLSGKSFGNVENLLDTVLDLPSRNKFWEDIRGCFKRVTTFVVLKESQVDSDSISSDPQNDFTSWLETNKEPYITMRGIDMSEDSKLVVVEEKVGSIPIDGAKVACKEEVAHLNKAALANFKLTKHYKLDENAFLLIPNLGHAEAGFIFQKLVEAEIINSNGELISINIGSNANLKLENLHVYRKEILHIVVLKCSYKYQLLEIMEMLESGSEEQQEIKLLLSWQPVSRFITEAVNLGLLSGRQANPQLLIKDSAFRTYVEKSVGAIEKFLTTNVVPITPEILHQPISDYIMDPVKQHVAAGEARHQAKLEADACLEATKEKLCLETQEMAAKFIDKIRQSIGKLKSLEHRNLKLVPLESILGNEYQADKILLKEEIETLALSAFEDVIDTNSSVGWTLFQHILLGVTIVAAIGIGIYLLTVPVLNIVVLPQVVAMGLTIIKFAYDAFNDAKYKWEHWPQSTYTKLVRDAIAYGMELYGIPVLRWLGENVMAISKRCLQFISNSSGMDSELSMNQHLQHHQQHKFLETKVIHACSLYSITDEISLAYQNGLQLYIARFRGLLEARIENLTVNHGIHTTGITDCCNEFGKSSTKKILHKLKKQFSSKSTSAVQLDAGLCFKNMVDNVVEKFTEESKIFRKTRKNVAGLVANIFDKLLNSEDCRTAVSKVENVITTYLGNLQSELKGYARKLVVNIAVIEEKISKRQMVDEFRRAVIIFLNKEIATALTMSFNRMQNETGQKLVQTMEHMMKDNLSSNPAHRLHSAVENVLKITDELDGDADEPNTNLLPELVGLCSQSRDPAMIAHVVQEGGPIGIEAVQAVATMLHARIEVMSDNPNIPQMFIPETMRFGVEMKTLKLEYSTQTVHGNEIDKWSSGSKTDFGERKPKAATTDSLLEALKNEMELAEGDGASWNNELSRESLSQFMKSDRFFGRMIQDGLQQTYYTSHELSVLQPKSWDKFTVHKGKSREMQKIQETEKRLACSKQTPNLVDSPVGPITRYYTEDSKQKGVAFVATNIDADILTMDIDARDSLALLPDPLKPRLDLKIDKLSLLQLLGWVLGGRALLANIGRNDCKRQCGLDRSKVLEIMNFVRHNEGRPSVEIRTIIDTNCESPTTPVCHTSHVIYRSEGKEYEDVIRILNDPDYKYAIPFIEPLERRKYDQRYHHEGHGPDMLNLTNE